MKNNNVGIKIHSKILKAFSLLSKEIDGTRMHIDGLAILDRGDDIQLVMTNGGFLLAHRIPRPEGYGKYMEFLITSTVLKDFLTTKPTGYVTIYPGDEPLEWYFGTENMDFSFRAYEVQYVDWQKLIPTELSETIYEDQFNLGYLGLFQKAADEIKKSPDVYGEIFVNVLMNTHTTADGKLDQKPAVIVFNQARNPAFDELFMNDFMGLIMPINTYATSEEKRRDVCKVTKQFITKP